MSACERYTEPESLGTMKEVKKFLLCEFQTLDGIIPAGSNILTALKTNRDSGDGQGVDEMSVGLGASPRDVTNWIREKDAHPVIWHLPDSKYSCLSVPRLRPKFWTASPNHLRSGQFKDAEDLPSRKEFHLLSSRSCGHRCCSCVRNSVLQKCRS